eukprot:Pgem_evm2s5653
MTITDDQPQTPNSLEIVEVGGSNYGESDGDGYSDRETRGEFLFKDGIDSHIQNLESHSRIEMERQSAYQRRIDGLVANCKALMENGKEKKAVIRKLNHELEEFKNKYSFIERELNDAETKNERALSLKEAENIKTIETRVAEKMQQEKRNYDLEIENNNARRLHDQEKWEEDRKKWEEERIQIEANWESRLKQESAMLEVEKSRNQEIVKHKDEMYTIDMGEKDKEIKMKIEIIKDLKEQHHNEVSKLNEDNLNMVAELNEKHKKDLDRILTQLREHDDLCTDHFENRFKLIEHFLHYFFLV